MFVWAILLSEQSWHWQQIHCSSYCKRPTDQICFRFYAWYSKNVAEQSPISIWGAKLFVSLSGHLVDWFQCVYQMVPNIWGVKPVVSLSGHLIDWFQYEYQMVLNLTLLLQMAYFVFHIYIRCLHSSDFIWIHHSDKSTHLGLLLNTMLYLCRWADHRYI